jgi:hypothetical protein
MRHFCITRGTAARARAPIGAREAKGGTRCQATVSGYVGARKLAVSRCLGAGGGWCSRRERQAVRSVPTTELPGRPAATGGSAIPRRSRGPRPHGTPPVATLPSPASPIPTIPSFFGLQPAVSPPRSTSTLPTPFPTHPSQQPPPHARVRIVDQNPARLRARTRPGEAGRPDPAGGGWTPTSLSARIPTVNHNNNQR